MGKEPKAGEPCRCGAIIERGAPAFNCKTCGLWSCHECSDLVECDNCRFNRMDEEEFDD